ncbi:MAG: hypothetical protein FWE36_04025 [Erysipelotrichales bacterium]|nr:hypothetical protein [Erysipelotrichales bacterium]
MNKKYIRLALIGKLVFILLIAGIIIVSSIINNDKVLVDIELTSSPDRTIYLEGETFDKTGMVITALFSDDSRTVVTDFTVDRSILSLGDTNVVVSYTYREVTKTLEVPVIVNELRDLIAISVTGSFRTDYIEGQRFDPTGMIVTALYENGESEVVQAFTIDKQYLSLEDEYIIVSYTENNITKTYEISVNVVAKSLESISVTTAPNRLIFVEGESFDSTGMVVTAFYDNNSSRIITDFTYDNQALTLADTYILISYEENATTKTYQLAITVIEKALERIEITGTFRTDYIEGQSFDDTGMIVTVFFNDGTSRVVTDFTLDKTILSLGDSIVVVSFEENGIIKTAEVSINVIARALERIEVSGTFRTNYIEGESFDATGMIVTAFYNDDTSNVITNFTLDKTVLALGDILVTVSYEDNGITRSAEISVNVIAKTLERIEVSGSFKTDYVEGQIFNPTGMIVTAFFDNGLSEVVTDFNYTNTALILTNTYIVVSYTFAGVTETVEVTITVNVRALIRIEVSGTFKTSYADGESFDTTGMIVTAFFNDDKSEVVTGFSLDKTVLTISDTVITVSYTFDGITVTSDIQISVHPIFNIIYTSDYSDLANSNPDTWNYTEGSILLVAAYSAEATSLGYAFSHWVNESFQTVTYLNDLAGDITLQAIFVRVVFSIEYVSNTFSDLDSGNNPLTWRASDGLITLVNPTSDEALNSAMIFAGWINVATGQRVETLSNLTSDLRLLAQFVPSIFYISFDNNQGLSDIDYNNPEIWDVHDGIIVLSNPISPEAVSEEMIFIGWFDQTAGEFVTSLNLFRDTVLVAMFQRTIFEIHFNNDNWQLYDLDFNNPDTWRLADGPIVLAPALSEVAFSFGLVFSHWQDENTGRMITGFYNLTEDLWLTPVFVLTERLSFVYVDADNPGNILRVEERERFGELHLNARAFREGFNDGNRLAVFLETEDGQSYLYLMNLAIEVTVLVHMRDTFEVTFATPNGWMLHYNYMGVDTFIHSVSSARIPVNVFFHINILSPAITEVFIDGIIYNHNWLELTSDINVTFVEDIVTEMTLNFFSDLLNTSFQLTKDESWDGRLSSEDLDAIYNAFWLDSFPHMRVWFYVNNQRLSFNNLALHTFIYNEEVLSIFINLEYIEFINLNFYDEHWNGSFTLNYPDDWDGFLSTDSIEQIRDNFEGQYNILTFEVNGLFMTFEDLINFHFIPDNRGNIEIRVFQENVANEVQILTFNNGWHTFRHERLMAGSPLRNLQDYAVIKALNELTLYHDQELTIPFTGGLDFIPTEHFMLFAVPRRNFTVYFETFGGDSVAPVFVPAENGVQFLLTSHLPLFLDRPGYKFLGWSLTEDGSFLDLYNWQDRTFVDQFIQNLNVDTTLYAVWQAITSPALTAIIGAWTDNATRPRVFQFNEDGSGVWSWFWSVQMIQSDFRTFHYTVSGNNVTIHFTNGGTQSLSFNAGAQTLGSMRRVTQAHLLFQAPAPTRLTGFVMPASWDGTLTTANLTDLNRMNTANTTLLYHINGLTFTHQELSSFVFDTTPGLFLFEVTYVTRERMFLEFSSPFANLTINKLDNWNGILTIFDMNQIRNNFINHHTAYQVWFEIDGIRLTVTELATHNFTFSDGIFAIEVIFELQGMELNFVSETNQVAVGITHTGTISWFQHEWLVNAFGESNQTRNVVYLINGIKIDSLDIANYIFYFEANETLTIDVLYIFNPGMTLEFLNWNTPEILAIFHEENWDGFLTEANINLLKYHFLFDEFTFEFEIAGEILTFEELINHQFAVINYKTVNITVHRTQRREMFLDFNWFTLHKFDNWNGFLTEEDIAFIIENFDGIRHALTFEIEGLLLTLDELKAYNFTFIGGRTIVIDVFKEAQPYVAVLFYVDGSFFHNIALSINWDGKLTNEMLEDIYHWLGITSVIYSVIINGQILSFDELINHQFNPSGTIHIDFITIQSRALINLSFYLAEDYIVSFTLFSGSNLEYWMIAEIEDQFEEAGLATTYFFNGRNHTLAELIAMVFENSDSQTIRINVAQIA